MSTAVRLTKLIQISLRFLSKPMSILLQKDWAQCSHCFRLHWEIDAHYNGTNSIGKIQYIYVINRTSIVMYDQNVQWVPFQRKSFAVIEISKPYYIAWLQHVMFLTPFFMYSICQDCDYEPVHNMECCTHIQWNVSKIRYKLCAVESAIQSTLMLTV